MISDDIGGLFASPPDGPAQPAAFRQAVLLDFNPDDGSNTVGIGPATLPDLPMLVTGAEIGLESGDNILVMYLGNTPMIVGKIASVGGPNYGVSNLGRDSFFLTLNNFNIPAAVTILLTGTVAVPDWANSVSITLTGTINIDYGAGTATKLTSEVRFSSPSQGDSFSDGVAQTIQPNTLGGTHASFSDNQNVTPGETCTVTLKAFASVAITSGDGSAWLSCRTEFYREAAS